METPQSLHHALEISRKELLDLGLRNPLLNHRTSKTRGLSIEGEASAELFRLLIKEGKTMTFLPFFKEKEKLVAPLAPGEEDDLGPAMAGGSDEIEPQARHDARIYTGFSPMKLQELLLRTFYTARTCIEEQGVNTLHLALGMLRWQDRETHEFHQAPLVLLPVELTRSSARERFKLRFTGEEVGPNLSLDTKLRSEYHLEMPPFPEFEDLDPSQYFAEVRETIQGYPDWAVEEDAVALDFFSFGKFLMYKDLDEERWPEDQKPSDHPVLRALLQDGFAPAEEEENDDADPLELKAVVDADSSQAQAMYDVKRGLNLVIQGPPGTGKSQTITNLIAEAVGEGKTVLFVSEKMAALEVVKRRLDSVGLGDACLELHSHKTNKKAVLDELARTLNLGKPAPSQFEKQLELHRETRDRLNAYALAVNEPIGSSGLTPHQAMGFLHGEAVDRSEFPDLALEDPAHWSEAEYVRRESLVEELQGQLTRLGPLGDHPFWGVCRTVFLPHEIEGLKKCLAPALEAVQTLSSAAEELAQAMELPVPQSRGACEALIGAAQYALKAPDLTGVRIEREWESQRDALEGLIEAGRRHDELLKRYEKQLIQEAWDQDLLPVRQALVAHGKKWYRFLIGEFRNAQNRLIGLCQEAPATVPEMIELVEAVLEAARLRKKIRHGKGIAARLFPGLWQEERTDWARLDQFKEWILELKKSIEHGHLTVDLMDYLAAHPDERRIEFSRLEEALSAHRKHLDALVETLEFEASRRFEDKATLPARDFAEQAALISLWAESLPLLSAMVRFNHLASQLEEERLFGVIELAKGWAKAPLHLLPHFRRTYLERLLEHAFRHRAPLAQFDGLSHEEAIQRFRKLDSLLIEHTRIQLAEMHWQALPRHEASGQLGILRREFEKKARHLPIRQLIGKAGHAIRAIKPVFMMSPLSIATFLASDTLHFDLVVFDEASQVKPVDAFGAILRGKQTVVVGDKKQMPPTDFFESLNRVSEEETATSDIESILGLFEAKGAPSRMLRWHYRSRHQSLIAVSNQEFYDDRLVIFPSPERAREKVGLIYRHLPTTHYLPGANPTNPGEAQAVAEAVMEHARTCPQLTLGVAAFSVAQMIEIQDKVEQLRREDPSTETFFAAHPHEPFFIKNLETIQGDERDVVFISIGYGRTSEGKVAMNFGPLNRDGGGRRLNVLITRARLRCEVFTNMTPDDIDLHRSNRDGVKALKRFLDYAASGIKEQGKNPSGTSSLGAKVKAALEAKGYRVETNVGVAGFFLDLAVVDPVDPDRYRLGIQCDGATYFGAKTARDRDRLRVQVLEGLGWRLHRVWSTDWYQHPERELERLLEALEEENIERSESPEIPDDSWEIERTDEAPEDETGVPEYRLADLGVLLADLPSLPLNVLAGFIVQVVTEESPVHRDEVEKRIAAAAGARRVGQRLQAALEAARKHAVKTGAIQESEGFLWREGMETPPLRDRRKLPSAMRKLELVSPEEWGLAIERVVEQSYGIEREKLPQAALKLLGFARISEDGLRTIERLIEGLFEAGRIEERGGFVRLVESVGHSENSENNENIEQSVS